MIGAGRDDVTSVVTRFLVELVAFSLGRSFVWEELLQKLVRVRVANAEELHWFRPEYLSKREGEGNGVSRLT